MSWDPWTARIRELEAENERLRAALRNLMENVGGHHHWDGFGTSGANCPICQRQSEAFLAASEALEQTGTKPDQSPEIEPVTR